MNSECVIFIVGVIVQIASEPSWPQFAVGRLISGLGIGALSAAVPMVSVKNYCYAVASHFHRSSSIVPSRDCSAPNPRSPHNHLPAVHHAWYSHCLYVLSCAHILFEPLIEVCCDTGQTVFRSALGLSQVPAHGE